MGRALRSSGGLLFYTLSFVRGLFQHALASIEYRSIEMYVWHPGQDLSSRLNCAPHQEIATMVLEISQIKFQTVSTREPPWYMYGIACQGLYALAQTSNNHPTPPLPNNAILQNPYLEPDAMGGLANSHPLDVAAPHVSSVLHEAQRQFARCFHQVSYRNAVCDERGAASFSISARHSFEFRILATHVAKKLICVSRVVWHYLAEPQCGGVLQTFGGTPEAFLSSFNARMFARQWPNALAQSFT